ncbi:hypothetical protein FOL47_004387 [Perkinsus chesapeaki]|uniref:K Homology domain-containing protein n=1 Tax=Perkinsus chesapeaki TaxID=330153 RepID=A0A7J6MZ48_PERCH|nr:hypothetical protein FOL47_004387 [Perkinsus chesapeaki]
MKGQNLLIKPNLLNPQAAAQGNGDSAGQTKFEGPPMVNEPVQTDCFRGRAFQSDSMGNNYAKMMKTKYGVSVSVAPLSGNGAVVNCRAPSRDQALAASKVIAKILAGFHVELIDTTDEVLDKLFDTTMNPDKTIEEIYMLGRVSHLKNKEPGVTIARSNPENLEASQIGIIVDDSARKEFPRIRDDVLDLIRKCSFTTETVKVPRAHTKTWGETTTTSVNNALNGEAMIFFRRAQNKDEESYMDIWGTQEGRERAKELLKQFYAPVSVAVPEEAVQPMLQDRCKVLQDIQRDAAVSLYYSKPDGAVFVYGLKPNKDKAVADFNKFLDGLQKQLSKYTIKQIELRSDEMGILIGPKGRTIRRITEESVCHDIRVGEDQIVTITGLPAAVDKAVTMIEEELNARKDVITVQSPDAEKENEPAHAETKSFLFARRDAGHSEKASESSKEEPVDLASTEQFPPLGAHPAGKPKKAKFRPSKKH